MSRKPQLLDRWGRPVETRSLTEEVMAPTVGGVRTPLTGTPADGLNPLRLAGILRAADSGDHVQYLELAEVIEERDPHYLGVLSTRKRSVSQIEITVEAASDAAEDVARADLVREWLKRDELTEELFDILDTLGKGYSFTEIIWDTSEGQWQPRRLEWRDPRWFRFARGDLATPLKLGATGQEEPLDAFKFIFASIRAKSGITLRSGLARLAAWGWMFKAFTQRDWAIFTQTYGQPLRVGKWKTGASEAEKSTLFRAVANIAGDCAAIIPESMSIDFVESRTVGGSSDMYRQRADWLDQQISKAVLGQTATTDAIAGGHAVGKEHRQVQGDIERADANALAAILNRDLVRPWMQLEFGAGVACPRIRIERPKVEDIAGLAEALSKLVPLGLEVEQSEVRDRLKLSEPEKGARTLSAPQPAPAPDPSGRDGVIERRSAEIKRGQAPGGMEGAGDVTRHSAGKNPGGDAVELLAEQMEAEAGPAVGEMVEQIEAMLQAAGSVEEFGAMLRAAYPRLGAERLAAVLAGGLMAAQLAGIADVEAGSA